VTTQPSETVLILGAGLTGLATAYHLSRRGYQVTVLDHPDWQDGYHANAADPAPILFGCHHETWHLLRTLCAGSPSRSGTILPLEFCLPDGRIVPYRSSHLPGALQWMTSLFSFLGLRWQDRWSLFSHLEQIWEQALSLPADLESRIADEWLTTIGQSEEARRHVWHPLAQWLTGNALSRLSAATFVQQLSTIFLAQAVDARLSSLAGSVESQLLAPLRAALNQADVRMQSQKDRPALRFEHQRLNGVLFTNQGLMQADWYVAALSHRQLLALLPERLLTRYAYFAQMEELTMVSEISIQLVVRSAAQTPRLILFAGRPFDRLVMSGLGSHKIRLQFSTSHSAQWSETVKRKFIELGRAELRLLQSAITIDGIESAAVYREDQAGLSLQPGTARLRPIQRSPIGNLLVAGAWTDTGWPANIESALVSARRCADVIAKTSV
jgi:glycine/D-amino acid oxidase-like deaminating enzyme